MATIGVRDLFKAKRTVGAEDKVTYEKPSRLAKAIKIDLSVETVSADLYADDGVDVSAKEFVKATLKLNVNNLSQEDLAEMLGNTPSEDGVYFSGQDDEPINYAIGYRAKKVGGEYEYTWLYNVQFKIPNDAYETKGSSINFKTPEIEATVLVNSDTGKWKARYVGKVDTEKAKKWFEAVVVPKTTVTPASAPTR